MDILDIDPTVLESTATIIEGYCENQINIMNSYLAKTSALSSDWTDNQTLGSLINEIKSINSNVISVMDEIRIFYPMYFRDKAKQMEKRPKM